MQQSHEFRIHEGVDTSYTKFDRKPDPIDDNPFDKIAPPRDLLNVGWTEPGEWFNITVDVVNAESMLLIFFTQRRDPFVNKLFDIFSVAA
jgi:hypothetical protein